MPKFRSKVVEIEAMQLSDSNREAVVKWVGENNIIIFTYDPVNLRIRTLEGDMLAQPGDWVIKGLEGEFYPCKDSVFKAKYELVK